MSSSVLTGYKNKIYFAAFWVSWAAIHAWVLTEWGYDIRSAWADSLISNALLAVVSILVSFSLRYYLPRKDQVTYLLLLCIGLTALWTAVAKLAFAYCAAADIDVHFSQSFPIRVAIVLLITGSFILLNVLWHTLQDQKEAEIRNAEAEKMARDAELFKLRQQLQPHFLFNSLNSISALVVTQPAASRKMIQQLSDYLRSTLRKEEHKWVSLAEELQYLQLYLDIEKVRFGHRLSTDISIPENAADLKIPALLLQPVVENAIKFGLYDTIGEITIKVKVTFKENTVWIRVENPFDASLSQPKTGTGFGLSSVQRRLHLLFGRADLLSTETREQQFITTIKIPQ